MDNGVLIPLKAMIGRESIAAGSADRCVHEPRQWATTNMVHKCVSRGQSPETLSVGIHEGGETYGTTAGFS
jgi:hypothetical protein